MLDGLQEYAEKADKVEKHTRQRWPRPCGICQSRKVKCDRATPCTNCQRRGEEHLCVPEVERENGPSASSGRKRKRAQQSVPADIPSLESAAPIIRPNPPSEILQTGPEIVADRPPINVETLDQICIETLSKVQRHLRPRPKWHDLVLPNSKTSRALVAHDRTWNSWNHQALHWAQFEKEHDNFLIMRQSGKPIASMDPSWLAIYFAVLAASFLDMDEGKTADMELPIAQHSTLLRRWYDAALFCLDEADYLRNPSVRTVQTIAILSICFDNLGDHDLRQTMWACAIRIALKLGLNHPEKMVAPLPMPAEHCIRLWWTMVIHDWISVPGYTPLVPERDIRCALPTNHTDDLTAELDGVSVSAASYQHFMARAAVAHHGFYNSLHKDQVTKSEVIRQADDRLVQLVARLPEHLKPGSAIRDAIVTELEKEHPWVRRQRVQVTLTYLTHRLLMYAILEPNWRSQPLEFNWARSICLQAARDIIWIDQNWNLSKSYRRHWSHSMCLFQAAYIVIQEAKHDASIDDTPGMNWRVQVAGCVAHLEEVQAWNAFAGRAAHTIKESCMAIEENRRA